MAPLLSPRLIMMISRAPIKPAALDQLIKRATRRRSNRSVLSMNPALRAINPLVRQLVMQVLRSSIMRQVRISTSALCIKRFLASTSQAASGTMTAE